jgi:hypothetical protein
VAKLRTLCRDGFVSFALDDAATRDSGRVENLARMPGKRT